MDVIPEQVIFRIVDNGVRLSKGRSDQGKIKSRIGYIRQAELTGISDHILEQAERVQAVDPDLQIRVPIEIIQHRVQLSVEQPVDFGHLSCRSGVRLKIGVSA